MPDINEIKSSIVTLLTEAYAGPPDPRSTWFVDNEPDSGILGALKNISAARASTSVDGSGKPGSTIAANVEHLRWSLANANRALRGGPYEGRWSESWNVIAIGENEWDALRRALQAEYETLCQAILAQADLPGEYLLGVMALVPHAAFHLGLIRQMVERVRA